MRPVIAITACNRMVGAEPAQAVMNRYVDATLRHAAADVVLVPAMPDLFDAASIVARVDAVLLTGSPSNVDPSRYGESGTDGPFDAGRDGAAMGLIEAALNVGKPLFGICRGFQEINVAFGGTLRRDVGIATLPHHAPEDATFEAMFDHGHAVTLRTGGVLARAFGCDTLDVNSVHYQGVGRLAPDLTAEAHAPDGLVEAISAEIGRASVLAVQWHPEWSADTDPASARFFHLLGAAARGTRPEEFDK